VLTTIGRTPEEAFASMRFGIGRFNTAEEVSQAGNAIVETVQSLS
jgi:cysteine desulfurase